MSKIIEVLTDTGFLSKLAGGIAIYILGLLKNPWKTYKTWTANRINKIRGEIIHGYTLEIEPSGFNIQPGIMNAEYNFNLVNKSRHDVRVNYLSVSLGGAGSDIDSFEDTKPFDLKSGSANQFRYRKELNDLKCALVEASFHGHPSDALLTRLHVVVNSTYKRFTVNSFLDRSAYMRVSRPFEK